MSEHTHDHHITPPKTLRLTLIALAGLMGLTILAAVFDVGHFVTRSDGFWASFVNNSVALAIAIVKAACVVQIFMGVKWGTQLVKIWAYFGFVWLACLLITLGDYTSRYWENNRGWYANSTEVTAFESVTNQRKKEQQEEFAREHAAETAKIGGH
jgi:caa(3)-type oxidase subunit IV